MAIRPLNSVGGFAVGELANVVVLPNGVITTSTANLTANLIANAVYTDNYKYANGVNVDFQTAAGNATEIQFKATGANDLAASANLTFDNATSLLNLQGTANISTVNVLGTGNALYVASNLKVGGTIYGNINGNIAAAGTNTQVLFNDNGTVNAVSGMTFVKTSNLLTISGNIDVQNLSNANLLSANYVSVSSNLTSGNANLGNLATANYLTITNNANINGTLNTANILVGGNIIPSANVTYNLGNNTNRFKDLWLSGNTIELGGANIKADGSNVTITTALGGSFTINGTQNANSGYIVNGTSNVLVSPNSSVTVSAQGNANVFTVTGNGVSITGTLAAGDTTITGNLTVTGTTTSVNSTVTQIVDPMFELGGGANGAALTTDDNKERGMLMHYYRGSAPVDAFMGWMNANSEFAFGSNVSVANNNVTINTLGNIRAGNASLGNLVTANYVNVTANLTSGNASLGNLATANYINVATDLTVGTGTGGNITGANLISANYVNVSSNLTAGNANLGNLASVNYLTINNAITIPDMIADSIIGHKANVNVSSNTVIDTFTSTKYRAAKYVIKASNDTGYQVLEAIIVHDNTDSYATIYGSISTTASDIVEIDTYIVGSNIELKANAVTASANTKVRLLGTYIAD
jgi:hypothetical protein